MKERTHHNVRASVLLFSLCPFFAFLQSNSERERNSSLFARAENKQNGETAMVDKTERKRNRER